MGKAVKNPKKHIISCRISAAEWRLLKDYADAMKINISDLLRQCVIQLCEEAEQDPRRVA